MFEFRLSTNSMSNPVLTFDGHVIELFFDDLRNGSRRVHVGQMWQGEIFPANERGLPAPRHRCQ
jgi:hypothetical protein